MPMYVLWCAGIAITAFAAHRMASTGLSSLLPAVWLYLATSAVYWVALLAARPSWQVYLGVYSAGVVFVLLVKCGALVSVFWAVTANYRNFRNFGSMFLGACSVIGVASAWLVSIASKGLRAHVFVMWLWHGAFLIERYTAVAILGTLLAICLLLPRSPRIPLMRYGSCAARLMAVDAAFSVASSWLQHETAYNHPLVAALIGTGYTCAVGITWLRLRVFEEIPAIGLSAEELHATQRRIAFDLQMIRAKLDDAIRAFERQG